MLYHMYSSSLCHEISKSAELGSESGSQLYNRLFQMGWIKEGLNKTQDSPFRWKDFKWH